MKGWEIAISKLKESVRIWQRKGDEMAAEIARLETENERLRRWDAKYTDGMTPTVAEQLLKCSATEFQGFWELICDVGEAERLQRWVRVKLKELAEAKDVVVEFLEAEAAMLDGQAWRLRPENQDHRHKRFSAAHDALKTAGDLQQPLEQEVVETRADADTGAAGKEQSDE